MNTPKFKPGQRIVRRNPELYHEIYHEIFTIDRVDERSGLYITKEKNMFGDREGYIFPAEIFDKNYVLYDSPEGIWARL